MFLNKDVDSMCFCNGFTSVFVGKKYDSKLWVIWVLHKKNYQPYEYLFYENCNYNVLQKFKIISFVHENAASLNFDI